MEQLDLKIAIIGAGIGGLTLALALREHGIDAQLYEQTDELREVGAAVALSANAKADIARVQQIWTECRQRYGKSGPFLFGAFGGADAMFAPVVHRFRSYAIAAAPEALNYMETMMSLPAFAEWTRDGLAETIVIPRFEND